LIDLHEELVDEALGRRSTRIRRAARREENGERDEHGGDEGATHERAILANAGGARKERAAVLRSPPVPPRDDVHHGNGASNGAPRRRPRRAADDDRPRGFEPDRMRRLWSDIDSARDNLGLGPEAIVAAAPGWTVAGVVGRAATLAFETAGAVATGTADLVRACARLLPDPRAVISAPRRSIGAAVPCVRRLPLVGALFD
jgi:hypothetical protein